MSVAMSNSTVVQLVELLCMRALPPLDVTVELGRTRRQYEEPDAQLSARRLEGSLELTASIDLDRPDGKGEPPPHRAQELCRQAGRGSGVHLPHVPPGDHVPGRVVLEHHTWQGGRMSRVSTCTISPGFMARYSLGLRTE